MAKTAHRVDQARSVLKMVPVHPVQLENMPIRRAQLFALIAHQENAPPKDRRNAKNAHPVNGTPIGAKLIAFPPDLETSSARMARLKPSLVPAERSPKGRIWHRVIHAPVRIFENEFLSV